MSRLSRIRKTLTKAKPRIILYGEEGIGKTTFAAMAPKPIFINLEDGLRNIDAEDFDGVDSYSDVLECLTCLAQEEHDYKTVCIDTLDWLERLVLQQVCDDYGVNSIKKAAGGYNNGYEVAVDKWREITQRLDYLSEFKDMYVICNAHRMVKEYKDPETERYDKFMLKLNPLANAYLFEWADIVMYAKKKMFVTKTDTGNRVAKAIGGNGGDRMLYTFGSPSCMGKTRRILPEELPFTWMDFEKALNASKGE